MTIGRRSGIALATLAAAACSGGVGPLPEPDNGWETHAGDRETPVDRTLDPEQRRNVAPLESGERPIGDRQLDEPPNRFACDGIYLCTIVYRGQRTTLPIVLAPKNGECDIGQYILADNGQISGFVDGQRTTIGTWKGGEGTIVMSVATPELGDGTITCERYTGWEVEKVGQTIEVQGVQGPSENNPPTVTLDAGR